MGDSRATYTAPCVLIAAADWLAKPDVKEWMARSITAATFIATDVFTTYDHGEGPASPYMSEAPDEEAMPKWLWDEIVLILKAKGLDREYCVIRLMDEE